MRRFVLVMAVLLSLAATLSAGAQGTTPPEVVFDFGDDVRDEDRALIREGIRFAQAYCENELGIALRAALTVEVRADPNAPTVGSAWGQRISISTAQQVWFDSSTLHKLKIIVHEYFHILQHQMTRGHDPGPVWLIEGSAELVGFSAVASAGLAPIEAVVDRWIYGALYSTTAGVPLEAMEPPDMPAEVRCCMYEVAPLAVRDLVRDGGLTALTAFYEQIGTSPRDKEWPQAFTQAFGQDIATFYATFAATRAQLYPLGYDQTLVQYPGVTSDGVGDVTIRSVSSPIARGAQALLTAITLPGIACSLSFTSASGNPLLTQTTRANPDGSVFWLWSVRTRLSEGDGRVDVTCGTNTATATVTLT